MSRYDKNIGRKFNKLTCVAHAELDLEPPSQSKYLFECDCGNTRIVRFNAVVTGTAQQCIECTESNHGMCGTPIYISWTGMKTRCNNSNYPNYHRYGGRGIKYAPEWESFSTFLADMRFGYFTGATLDRIDNDGDYCKDNCQWLTKSENASKGAG